MSAHRYWRVKFTNTTTGAVTGSIWLANLCFLSQDGLRYSDSTPGGSTNASASSTYVGYAAAAAFSPGVHSGQANTGWSSAVGAAPHWLAFDHRVAVDVRQVVLTMNRYTGSNSNTECPVAGAIVVEYSDDNVAWTPATIIKSYTGPYARGRTYKIELDDYIPPALPVQVGAWWNSVAGKTAVAAWDAVRTTPQSMLDGVGNNHLNFAWKTGVNDFQFWAKYGDGYYPTFDSAFSTAGRTIFILYKNSSIFVTLSGTPNTGYYDLHQSNNAHWYSNGTSGLDYGGTGFTQGLITAAASTTNGAVHTIYVNGAKVGGDSTALSQFPSDIATVGYHDGTGYNLKTNDVLYAMAVFDGILTAPQLAALDTTVRAYLASGTRPMTVESMGDVLGRVEHPSLIPPSTPRSMLMSDTLGRRRNEIQAMLNGEAAHVMLMPEPLGRFDTFCSGTGVIVGTVKYTPGQPVHRRVRLLDEATGIVIDEIWSDPVTGAYTFTQLNRERPYTVLGYDYTHNYRAVIADNIMAGDAP